MQKEMIIAAVIGMLLIVVSFNLFVPLNRATANLYQYFVASCQDGNSRFQKAYVGVTSLSSATAQRSFQYDTSNEIFGGPGKKLGGLTTSGGACTYSFAAGQGILATQTATVLADIYNEQGVVIVSGTTVAAGVITGGDLDVATYVAYQPADLLGDFIGIIRTLVSLAPVLATAGFLALAGVGLVRYGMGVGSGGIGNAVGAAVMTLIINIVVMYLSPIGMDAVVTAGQSTQTGAMAVNQEFRGVSRLLFSVIPLVMVATIIGSNLIAGIAQTGMGGKMMGSMKKGMSM